MGKSISTPVALGMSGGVLGVVSEYMYAHCLTKQTCSMCTRAEFTADQKHLMLYLYDYAIGAHNYQFDGVSSK